MVRRESRCVSPPGWATGRRALEPMPLGGYELRPGDAAVMAQWVVHRAAELWPDPLRFDPLRFEPARKAQRHRFAYFPFGGGPRVWTGAGFPRLAGRGTLPPLPHRWRVQ